MKDLFNIAFELSLAVFVEDGKEMKGCSFEFWGTRGGGKEGIVD